MQSGGRRTAPGSRSGSRSRPTPSPTSSSPATPGRCGSTALAPGRGRVRSCASPRRGRSAASCWAGDGMSSPRGDAVIGPRPSGSEPWERPGPADGRARSEAVERRIRTAAARIADPGLRRLLEGTLPNTLDTTIVEGGTDDRPDTFVLTGDIEAMWLRDSTAQVWPYLASVTE